MFVGGHEKSADISGVVPLSAIPDDFIFDPATGQLTGRHTRRVIRLGENLVVQIYKLDSFKKQVDFMLVPSRDRPTRQDRPERQERRGPPDREPRQTAAPRKPGHGHKRAQKRRKT